MFGDVNISAILDSLTDRYDKRIRPNYGGLLFHYINLPFNFVKKKCYSTRYFIITIVVRPIPSPTFCNFRNI